MIGLNYKSTDEELAERDIQFSICAETNQNDFVKWAA